MAEGSNGRGIPCTVIARDGGDGEAERRNEKSEGGEAPLGSPSFPGQEPRTFVLRCT